MSHLTNFDAALNLELAEHAFLTSLGWHWETYMDIFKWVAPDSHKGSHRNYVSRAHAINSVKRWHLNNPKQRLSLRGEE